MKPVLVLALALGLSGCGSTDFFGDSASDAPAAPMVEASAPTPAPIVQDASAPPASTPVQQPAPMPVQTADSSAGQPPVMQDAPAPVVQASSSPSAHCTTLAKQRARDAAFQGEDPDTQEDVYNRTYSDCVAWDLKHAFR